MGLSSEFVRNRIMSQNYMNQPLILPNASYVLPSSGLSVFSPYQPTAGLGQTFSLIPQQHAISSTVVAQPHANSSFFMRYAPTSQLASPPALSSDASMNEQKDFRIITWEELRNLFPKPGPEGRVETGLLSDGRAYAQKTAKRDNYFLFTSKSSYILYFIHYYFSRDNLDRDKTIRGMMLENTAVSVEKLIQAPRLASIGTTASDLELAIANSSILCIVHLADGRSGVRRYDGYTGTALDTDSLLTTSNATSIDSKRRVSVESGMYSDSQLPQSPPPPGSASTTKNQKPEAIPLTPFNPTSGSVTSNSPSKPETPLSASLSSNNNNVCDPSPSMVSSLTPSDFRQVSVGSSPSPTVPSSVDSLPASSIAISPLASNPYSIQQQALQQAYSGDYQSHLQTTSCAFNQQMPIHFIGRPTRTTPIDVPLAAVAAAMSIGHAGGPPPSGVGAASIQSQVGLHMLCPQLTTDRGGVPAQSQQLPANAYRNLVSPTDQPLPGQHNVTQSDAAYAAFASFAAHYLQHQHRSSANQFQPGQQLYSYPLHLHAQQAVGRRNTPPPNQPQPPSYFHMAAAQQSMHPACQPPPMATVTAQQPGSFFPLQKPAGFSFTAPRLDASVSVAAAGYPGFRSSFAPQQFVPDSVFASAWDTHALAAAATTGIHLQYATPAAPTQNSLVGSLPIAFEQLSMHSHRPPLLWSHQAPSVIPIVQPPLQPQQMVHQPTQVATKLDVANGAAKSSSDVHPCAVDDPSIVAVTDSGGSSEVAGKVPGCKPSDVIAGNAVITGTTNTTRTSKGKVKALQKSHAAQAKTLNGSTLSTAITGDCHVASIPSQRVGGGKEVSSADMQQQSQVPNSQSQDAFINNLGTSLNLE